MVMPNRIHELRNLYFQQQTYRQSCAQNSADPAEPGWLTYRLPGQQYRESDLLRRVLSAESDMSSTNIADKIFGTQLRKNYVNLQHSLNLLRERTHLHEQHLKEIEDRHQKVQERLFGTEINHFPDRDRQIRNWESQLSQLEQQKREEEVSFWKDTVDLRKELFQAAGDYNSTHHRYRTLTGLGESDGVS